ncbi:MAG TPA: beta-galactosidase [Arachnia sp.]|nr:beta-galactosidase [Arachnia sp.]
MYYGGDYNPEQWPEEVWLEDARLMREARVNLVSVGIFSWARIQPTEGVFDFGWLDRVLDILHAHGIGVCLATATASPPPWLGMTYPSALPEDRDGSRFWHGSRQAYAPTSPDYRRLAGELVAAIAGRYASHPAVQLWHVNNEFGCHLPADYSDNAARGFRVWLAERYAGIEDLNRAWGTAFWSQRYGSFDEIVPPRKAPYSLNPAGVLDFKRFTSDALLGLFLMEKGIIRDAGATQPVTTNFMGAFEPLDYHRWAPHLDVIADDSYPDPNDPDAWRSAAFTRDLIRSLKPDTPWILMEQASNAVNWRPSNAPKAPGEMAALSMQAVARGADGVMFFQWRQSSAGSEKFHSAMLPHAGTGTRTWRDVVGLGAALEELPPLGGLRARVALVYDWENRWAIEQPDHPVTLDYLAQIQRWHAALLDLGVLVDVVDAEADLGPYDTVFAPLLYLLTERAAQGLLTVVERGGTVLTGPFSDVVDEHDRFREGGFTTLLGGRFGMHVTDFGALALTPPGQQSAPVAGALGTFEGTHCAEELTVDTAEVLASFEGGRADAMPAVTMRTQGEGRAIYVATIPDDEGLRSLVRLAARPAEAAPEPGAEVVRRGDVTFVIDHVSHSVTITPH